jgi:hypothetical protein
LGDFLFVGVFIFGSVWFLSKKVTKPNLKKKKTETGSNRPVSVRFFRAKPVQTSLARFFWFGSVFFGFFGSGSVRFFRFQA